MIEFRKNSEDKPYIILRDLYKKALDCNQMNIEAIVISSYNKNDNEVNSRFVNLKYVENDKWVFFTNYNSPKSRDFNSHSQISAIFHWNMINIQIRVKANIKKLPSNESDAHFMNRDPKKNALAVASNQSSKVESHEYIKDKYLKVLNSQNEYKRPDYWGGYTFTPYYFEFWEGHPARLNKRDSYELIDGNWKNYILEP